MPGVLKSQRETAIRFSRVAHYIAYAAGEILLIFIGITLAISFDNANERRRAQELEIEILESVEQNLVANIAELERNISWDSETGEQFGPLLEHMLDGRELNSSLERTLGRTRMWTTPYFATSGYENLKQLGLHLVTQRDIRDGLVQLFENTYARLLGDVDAGQREFGIAVMHPVINRELEYVDSLATTEDPLRTGIPAMRVRDYEGALRRGELVHMLSEHRITLLAGIAARENAREETRELLAMLRNYLSEYR